MRFGLNKDLGFSEKDRNENIRRIGEVCFGFCEWDRKAWRLMRGMIGSEALRGCIDHCTYLIHLALYLGPEDCQGFTR